MADTATLFKKREKITEELNESAKLKNTVKNELNIQRCSKDQKKPR